MRFVQAAALYDMKKTWGPLKKSHVLKDESELTSNFQARLAVKN